MTVRVEKPSVNLREKLAELDKPTGIAGEAMLRAETPQEQFNLIGAGRRNLIINGDFQVSQRGDYSSATNITSGNFWLDRWKFEGTISRTVQRVGRAELPNGDTAYSAKTITTASGTGYIGQRYIIEDFAILSKKNVVWSFWYKTNSKDFVLRHSGTKNLDFTAVADGQWHYATVPYFFPEATTSTSSAGGTGFYFATLSSNGGNVSLATGDYFEVAQVQLELGKVATPFEHRSYGEELALCQRYYWRQVHTVTDENIGVSSAYNTQDTYAIVHHPVTMRSAPSFSSSAASTFKIAGDATTYTPTVVSGFNLSKFSFSFQLRNTGITQGNSYLSRFSGAASSSNYIELDAEL